jgi:hypothetical protein
MAAGKTVLIQRRNLGINAFQQLKRALSANGKLYELVKGKANQDRRDNMLYRQKQSGFPVKKNKKGDKQSPYIAIAKARIKL